VRGVTIHITEKIILETERVKVKVTKTNKTAREFTTAREKTKQVFNEMTQNWVGSVRPFLTNGTSEVVPKQSLSSILHVPSVYNAIE
jgi:hypothetical protein